MLGKMLKKKIAVALTIAMAVSLVPSVPVSAASTLIPNGWYYIKNVSSQKYVEVAGGKDANGANVQQYQGIGNASQRWYVSNVGDNYITLKSGLDSGRMMDVVNGSKNSGTNVQIYQANGADAQVFKVKHRGNKEYTLSAKCSGNKMALTVSGTSNGGNVYLSSSKGNANQLFKFESISSSSENPSKGEDKNKDKDKDKNKDKGNGSGNQGGNGSGNGSGNQGGNNSGSQEPVVSGNSIEVKNGGTTLSAALSKAKSGTTIVINGTVKSGAVKVPAGVHISGKNNAVIDFSSTSGSNGRGLTFEGNGSKVSNITVKNASDNGLYITGSNNTFTSVEACYNQDAGFQVCNGGAYNKFIKCHSHHNADAKGENADGFANKLHSGEGNYYEECIADYNSDDGWDCYAAHGAVTLVNCQANFNGYCNGIYGDGNGFKMGGVDNKTPGQKAHLDPLKHTLTGCSAKGNLASGFDRNNQSGVVTMKNCTADSNKKNNYNWPASGKPSALGYQVTFGKAQIIDCKSINGKNNISGAVLSGRCSGF
ncbi:Right handed beta helix region [Pseudobutyrivibrio sp. 49]|uniref:RICIN domain-containing protein n=1 Tax=Pseudobutyrivibrio sp. 49 TaxID=1855344 RepID=UPI0008898EA4|nr:RICIN domain-containing protein [Pseudobutyrivibrio sp. 49]SDH99467.1 Right handed beta helix region [Pseudobutyrivibrio sp. 49]